MKEADNISSLILLSQQMDSRLAEDDAQIAVLHGREHGLSGALRNQESVGQQQVDHQCYHRYSDQQFRISASNRGPLPSSGNHLFNTRLLFYDV